MPYIVSSEKMTALLAELEAYRATGLTPEQIPKFDPAPLPLDLTEGGDSIE